LICSQASAFAAGGTNVFVFPVGAVCGSVTDVSDAPSVCCGSTGAFRMPTGAAVVNGLRDGSCRGLVLQSVPVFSMAPPSGGGIGVDCVGLVPPF
jgi:hypothetical protein